MLPSKNSSITSILPGGGGGGGGGGCALGYLGGRIKIKKYPLSTDFWPKRHPSFNKNANFLH